MPWMLKSIELPIQAFVTCNKICILVTVYEHKNSVSGSRVENPDFCTTVAWHSLRSDPSSFLSALAEKYYILLIFWFYTSSISSWKKLLFKIESCSFSVFPWENQLSFLLLRLFCAFVPACVVCQISHFRVIFQISRVDWLNYQSLVHVLWTSGLGFLYQLTLLVPMRVDYQEGSKSRGRRQILPPEVGK